MVIAVHKLLRKATMREISRQGEGDGSRLAALLNAPRSRALHYAPKILDNSGTCL